MLEQGGEHLWQCRLARAIRIARFLKGQLVAALRPNDPDVFRSFLAEGIQELGATEVEELLLNDNEIVAVAKVPGRSLVELSLAGNRLGEPFTAPLLCSGVPAL